MVRLPASARELPVLQSPQTGSGAHLASFSPKPPDRLWCALGLLFSRAPLPALVRTWPPFLQSPQTGSGAHLASCSPKPPDRLWCALGRLFSRAPRPALVRTWPPIQRLPLDCSPGLKWPGCEADHSLPPHVARLRMSASIPS